MPRFPIEYDVELTRGSTSPFEVRAGDRSPVRVGAPPEFGGSDMWWSPEHLFAASVAGCFSATFFSIADHASLRVGKYVCRSKAFLDRTPDGVVFTAVNLSIEVRVTTDDITRTDELLTKAKEKCFVANSLRCPVTVSAVVLPS